MPTRACERLLQAADDLFYAEGIRAVGVERLLAVSGVGRASFYRHFSGKEELVAAVLRRRDERWRAWLEEAVAKRGNDPLAVFDALAEGAEAEDYRGCAFINAMVEITDPGSEVHRLAAEHKRAVNAFVDRLLADAGHADHQALADQFTLLMDGAIVIALRTHSGEPARRAKAIAARLLS
ncbi:MULTISPECIES: TetR/AcrR family transcriptional regulator [Streptomycetaceae]|uniref:TetR/AcrR family transcriptional regulator n=1 Tax=Streptomycetaceae TaxID=2062 RepID=UPI000213FC57|nr:MULTISPECIES: TetR/AcrR family transcriptional regulator [Streptomycetaceae]MYS61133.1 TetR family transcriptional regulator [Streptomyces sp. SID5468]CCB76978.1 Transcriptional regulator, TetR family [Streptantibioticus cattleyicolor NRRL 8057 = DSM 46488]